MAVPTLKRSPLTAATITPPSINPQHSYADHEWRDNSSSNNNNSKRHSASSTATSASSSSSSTASPTDASRVLAHVVSRAGSPGHRHKSPGTSPLPSPLEAPSSARDCKSHWDDCRRKRDGYVSFPDFDQLRAERECREPRAT